jgi:FlaG/FlaF family flagellin (archaellin)
MKYTKIITTIGMIGIAIVLTSIIMPSLVVPVNASREDTARTQTEWREGRGESEVEWICFQVEGPWGNDFCLPTGRTRGPVD